MGRIPTRTAPAEATNTELTNTSDDILRAAISAFGKRGFEATSLDAIALDLGLRKQSILYWYSTKQELYHTCSLRVQNEVRTVLEGALRDSDDPCRRVERLVSVTFRLATQRPELLLFLRSQSWLDADRLDERRLDADRPDTDRHMRPFVVLEELVERALRWFAAMQREGIVRDIDPRFLLLSAYSIVLGVALDRSAQRSLGIRSSTRELVRRKREVLRVLHFALFRELAVTK